MKPSREPRHHLRVVDAARRLGHERKWILKLIAQGELEGFKHSHRVVTVSIESIVAYEERTRMGHRPEEAPA